MKRLMFPTPGPWVIVALGCVWLWGCSDDGSPTSSDGPVVYELLASHCDPLVIAYDSGQTVTFTVTDSVITNINGVVEDCDFSTDADGIPDCHYVQDQPLIHGLSFMALIG